jgi:flavin-binding protein dodecin
MSESVYSVTEIVGSSSKSIEDAIDNAIATASKTLRNLDWFEVIESRGHIVEGKVGHYQVHLKLGFRYDQSG